MIQFLISLPISAVLIAAIYPLVRYCLDNAGGDKGAPL